MYVIQCPNAPTPDQVNSVCPSVNNDEKRVNYAETIQNKVREVLIATEKVDTAAKLSDILNMRKGNGEPLRINYMHNYEGRQIPEFNADIEILEGEYPREYDSAIANKMSLVVLGAMAYISSVWSHTDELNTRF